MYIDDKDISRIAKKHGVTDKIVLRVLHKARQAQGELTAASLDKLMATYVDRLSLGGDSPLNRIDGAGVDSNALADVGVAKAYTNFLWKPPKDEQLKYPPLDFLKDWPDL